MRIAIGMLVYNGADTLPNTLRSLLDQQILSADGVEATIHVVANGCNDQSVAIAQDVLKTAHDADPDAGWGFHVHDLVVANKCAAWEYFVHEAAERDADHLIMLDCDILFGDGDTLGVMIAALEHDVTLDIATSLPVKHVEIDAVGLLERLSARTNDARLDAHAVCGQLYAARASVLRQVHMPIGLEVEDGLIRAMVLTDGFRGPERLERVRRVGDARHIYEAHVTPKLLIRHEAWLIRELVKLRYLCVAFEALPLAGTNRHAGNSSPPSMQLTQTGLPRCSSRHRWIIARWFLVPFAAVGCTRGLIKASRRRCPQYRSS